MINVTFDFTKDIDITNLKLSIDTNKGCFPNEFEVNLQYPGPEGSKDPSITNFTTAILLAGIFFIYEMIG